MKFSNSISNSHQTFASVFLAFSLFGFRFPHHPIGAKQNHQVNLKTSEQTGHTKTNDSEPRYKNPRVHPGTPYNQGWWPDP
jgi:hypothetical protein